MDQRGRNVRVFEETVRLTREDADLREAVATSLAGQRVVLEGRDVSAAVGITAPSSTETPGTPDATQAPLQVVVSKKRTLEAARPYSAAGLRTCVHNFASATNPGGGVTRGSSAQEESLCRCTTLYPCLNTPVCWDAFYRPHRAGGTALYNDDVVYTPGVAVMRDDGTLDLLDSVDRYRVDAVTCAAPNLRRRQTTPMNPGADHEPVLDLDADRLIAVHLRRARRILEVASEFGAQALVTGAFGCGAFQNSPAIVAHAWHLALDDYEGPVRTVEFAVWCRADETANYRAFADEFAR